MHVLIQKACCMQGMVPWVGADHWEGWTQGRGWADVEMPNPGNATARSLELGPTWDTPRSHGEYSVSSRDRRAVCLSSLPSHALVRGYPRSRVLFTWPSASVMCYSDWVVSPSILCNRGWESPGAERERVVSSGSMLQSDPHPLVAAAVRSRELNRLKRCTDAREALDTVKWFVGKVALQKHRGNSVLFDYRVRKTA